MVDYETTAAGSKKYVYVIKSVIVPRGKNKKEKNDKQYNPFSLKSDYRINPLRKNHNCV